MDLYTKNGHPLQVAGEIVYGHSGAVVGRIKGDKVYGAEGHYIGTIVSDRLVHRSGDASSVGAPFSAVSRAPSAKANAPASPVWGDEPKIPG